MSPLTTLRRALNRLDPCPEVQRAHAYLDGLGIREAARGVTPGATHYMTCWREHAGCAEARLRALKNALERYGQHEDTCGSVEHDGRASYCTCGLDDEEQFAREMLGE